MFKWVFNPQVFEDLGVRNSLENLITINLLCKHTQTHFYVRDFMDTFW